MTPVARRLTGLEHAFVAHEVGPPVGNLQIGGLSSFAGPPPSLAEVRELVASRLDDLPVLTMALHRDGRRLTWVPRPGADLARHVHEWVAEPGGDRAAADAIMARRLVRDAPPWEFWLVRGYAEDEWAVLFKAHHALMDGASLIEATCRLSGLAPRRPARVPRRVARRRRADVLTVARGSVKYLSRFLPLATGAFAAGPRDGVRRFTFASGPLSRLRGIADRHGCTLNDVFLAAFATALREWPHTPWRRGVRPVWTLVPADLHERDGDGELGARVVNLRVPLPCDDPDPVRRLRRIARATAEVKGGGHVAVGGAGERSMPRWFVRLIFGMTFSRAHVDVLASNVRGPRQLIDCLGAPLKRMAPLGFIPRHHPLAAYLMTHDDNFCAGFAVDSALPDGRELGRSWLRALDDLDAPTPAAASGPGARC